MKAKNVTLNHSLGAVVCMGAAMFMASSVSAQNLFVANASGNAVYEVSGGTPSPYLTGLNYSIGVAFDNSGDLFVSSCNVNAGETGYITKVTPGGTASRFYSGVDAMGLAFYNGNLYQADNNSGNIYEYTSGGTRSTFYTGLVNPFALAFDSAGDLFVAGGNTGNNGYIDKITQAQTESSFATGLNTPGGLAFHNGNLFVSSEASGVITEFTAPQTSSTYATISGDVFNGLAFDNSGNLFIAGETTGGQGLIEEISGGNQSVYASIPGIGAELAFQVPEPSTYALLAFGAAAFFVARRKYGNRIVNNATRFN